MAKKVCIDAGHYGKYNRCPNNASYYESEVMWKLHLLQKKYLEQYGIEVILTRNDLAKDLGLTARGQMAKGCDLFISNHSNAVGSFMSESVDHVVAYHLVNDTTTKCDDISKDIATKLAKVVTDVMGVAQPYIVTSRQIGSDRNGDGLMNDNYYGVLHGARLVNVPAVLIEHSFHTNTRTVKWLLDNANLDRLAKAEAECIAKHLGVSTTPKPSAPKPTTPSQTNDIFAGKKLSLDNVSAYNSYDSLTSYGKKTGTFYLWSDEVVKNRIRITNAPERVGVKGQVTCWIDVADLSKPTQKVPFSPYMVKIDILKIYDRCLNVRQEPNGASKIMDTVTKTMCVTIVDEAKDSSGNTWGLLKSYQTKRNGWIRLDYASKI